MGTVTFRFYASARSAAGEDEAEVPAGPVAEVLAALQEGRSQRFSEVLAACSLLCDGRHLDRESGQPLPDGAVVDVLPPFAGG